MKPNQNNQDQQRRQPENAQREVNIRGNKTVVETHFTQEMGAEETVNNYNERAESLLNKAKTVKGFQDRIEQTLEEHPEKMTVLHNLFKDQPQQNPDDLPSKEQMINTLEMEDIRRYGSLKQIKDQKNELYQKVENSLQELQQLHRAAKQHADRENMEIEKDYKELEEEVNNFLDQVIVEIE